jgi:antitoxin ParD1/3/4
MAPTRPNVGPHWERLIRIEIASGRYGSDREVVAPALRELENEKRRTDVLRAHLAEGAAEAERGEFIGDFRMRDIVAEADRRE